ncbi:MAG: hypothetical protein IKU36_10930 [Bacteroidales bacterium]|nr:hypothetical protein [Bacteroidales bacterium]
MRTLLKIFMILACLMACHEIYASGPDRDDTPAIKALQSGKKTRRLEGATLKLARPILKKTPMSVVMDDIDMMMFCPVEKNNSKDGEFAGKVKKALKGYMLAHEIDDELSHMLIYVDEVKGNRFTELILYITSPDQTILYFRGDFTVEALMKVGELSEQDRKKRIKNKREGGQDDSYLQYVR